MIVQTKVTKIKITMENKLTKINHIFIYLVDDYIILKFFSFVKLYALPSKYIFSISLI